MITHWGSECLCYGDTTCRMTLGSGADVLVRSVQGFASAGPTPGVKPDSGNLRQTLIVLQTSNVAAQASAAAPPGGCNNEVDGNMLAVNIKQVGYDCHAVPIKIDYDPPVRVSSGTLSLLYVNQTNVPSGTPGGETTTLATECIDAECHLIFEWEYA